MNDQELSNNSEPNQDKVKTGYRVSEGALYLDLTPVQLFAQQVPTNVPVEMELTLNSDDTQTKVSISSTMAIDLDEGLNTLMGATPNNLPFLSNELLQGHYVNCVIDPELGSIEKVTIAKELEGGLALMSIK